MYFFDTEVYRNYFLMTFLDLTGKTFVYERLNDEVTLNTMNGLDKSDLFISFNGIGYDLPIIGAWRAGKSNRELKEISDQIILTDRPYWEITRQYNIPDIKWNHIDISNVLFGKSSLKLYGGRIHAPTLQDLPIDPSAEIMETDLTLMREYCTNDCRLTQKLYRNIEKQIELRYSLGAEYGCDLRSKSDAQIAETVIAGEYLKLTDMVLLKPADVAHTFTYDCPDFIQFDDYQLKKIHNEILDTTFKLKESGHVEEPDSLKRVIEFKDNRYKMGIGGLHSVDKPGSFRADDDHDVRIYDIDVASYYPSIILNAEYEPTHMKGSFLNIYRQIVEKRLTAKASGDKLTADTLKITINGTFGKLGSKYSKMYAPDLMANVTITGQLALLMLIEQMPCEVISANTDGIMVVVRKDQLQATREAVSAWEQQTGFDMEWTQYRSVHRRDVNNYLAITTDRQVKTKGVFARSGMSKNPAFAIIYKAVIEYHLTGAPIADTVRESSRVADFITVRTVKGGAKYQGNEIGKVVRWYRSWLSADTINYATNGNKVPLTDNAVPVQKLPDSLPVDIDYDWYIEQAEALLEKMQ